MADFRRMLYAFALVALLVGLTVPASAQTTLMVCTGTANNPLVRGEDYTALAGDIFVNCTGGIPTAVGALVPKVDIVVFTTSTTITSKLTDVGPSPNFNEALLIVDEAGSASTGTTFPILNCGNAGAPFGSTPFSCDTTGTGTGATTYDGAVAVGGTSGHPNVFQARQVSTSAGTAIQFLGVPLDPKGNDGISNSRTLRITNIRVDATKLGIFGTGAFTNAFITTTVNFNGTNFGGSQVISVVNATVRGGLVVSKQARDSGTFANFLQCTATAGNAKNDIRIEEGFATAFKVRNWQQIQANGTPPGGGTGDWSYAAGGSPTWNPTDVNQNVPNALYNTESGLMFPGSSSTGAALANPSPGNPPPGTGPSGASPGGRPFFDVAGAGGINQAGTVTQGTRFAITFSASPAGSFPSIPNVVLLKSSGVTTGAIALVLGADASGAGGVPTGAVFFPGGGGTTLLSSLPGGLAVYEVLFSNPSAIERATITVTVAPVVNLTSTPATPDISGLTATVGFAPFYAAGTSANVAQLMNPVFTFTVASSDGKITNFFPIPRFLNTNQGPFAIYDYSKCACDLLFPWVVGDGTFTTSIVIANTSLDPCAGALLTLPPGTCAAGFTAAPQSGKVTFWYYGTTGISLDPTTPISTQASQTSSVAVPPGSYLAHIVSPGAAGTTAANGLTKLAANFAGYVVAQAQFQYCHAIAAISANVPGFGTQTYIGLMLDKGLGEVTEGGLSRTVQTTADGLIH